MTETPLLVKVHDANKTTKWFSLSRARCTINAKSIYFNHSVSVHWIPRPLAFTFRMTQFNTSKNGRGDPCLTRDSTVNHLFSFPRFKTRNDSHSNAVTRYYITIQAIKFRWLFYDVVDTWSLWFITNFAVWEVEVVELSRQFCWLCLKVRDSFENRNVKIRYTVEVVELYMPGLSGYSSKI